MTKIPAKMKGFLLTGHGGFDKLVWKENLPIPSIDNNEVLIRVLAASINNTDINTRVGWYAKSVTSDTGSFANSPKPVENGGWSEQPVSFPRIQGADCCGEIVAVGKAVSKTRIGERVIVRPMQSTASENNAISLQTFGSEYDGAFSEYTKTHSKHALRVKSDLTDTELASLPCAYSTAEGMLQRVNLQDENVLITGASGGVGLAAVQLAKRRGANVTAMVSEAKRSAVLNLGANETVTRGEELGSSFYDVVVDLVAGPRFPDLISSLKNGGRYVVAGAIAGPMVELDIRDVYLRDLTLFGSTHQPDSVMEDLVTYVESNQVKPEVAKIFDLEDLHSAQRYFMDKAYVGKVAIRVS